MKLEIYVGKKNYNPVAICAKPDLLATLCGAEVYDAVSASLCLVRVVAEDGDELASAWYDHATAHEEGQGWHALAAALVEQVEDTRRLYELAPRDFACGGFFDDIAREHGHCSGKSAADELDLWDLTVAQAVAVIAEPIADIIEHHMDDIYEGQHRCINQRVVRSVRELLVLAEASDHWHDLNDAEKRKVERLLDFHCDYLWKFHDEQPN